VAPCRPADRPSLFRRTSMPSGRRRSGDLRKRRQIKAELGRVFARLRQSARALKREVHAIYLSSRDPRVPWYAKAAAICIAAYALSPIDLIPDFIPVLGHLDELVLLPLAILLVIKLIPPEVLAEHRVTVEATKGRPVSRAGAVAIVTIWLASAASLAWLIWP
jgi:uncharacterized membrane protein YkvA (DUF1232 family)